MFEEVANCNVSSSAFASIAPGQTGFGGLEVNEIDKNVKWLSAVENRRLERYLRIKMDKRI